MNKFVLANILKNFRWLKFDYSKLKQFINCPRCYSLSLRYSIYKVQTRFPLSRLACLLYHSSVTLSRTFFKFFHFSSLFFLSTATLADSLHMIPPPPPFVNTLFLLFSTFFTSPKKEKTGVLFRTPARFYFHSTSSIKP